MDPVALSPPSPDLTLPYLLAPALDDWPVFRAGMPP
jgi:hypothetical protein